jgi:hypothetical protein
MVVRRRYLVYCSMEENDQKNGAWYSGRLGKETALNSSNSLSFNL